MIRRPPRATQSSSSAASDVYKRQVEFGATLGVHHAHAETIENVGEDLVIGFRLAERFDAFVLQHDHAMVELRMVVMDVTRTSGPVANIPAFNRGAGRQDDVGIFRIALIPDRLVDHAFNRRMTIGFDEAGRV